jgi:hypothetical protein
MPVNLTAATSVVLRTETLCALRALTNRMAQRDGGRRSVSALVQEALDRVLPLMQDEDEKAEAERQRARMVAALRAARVEFLGRYSDLTAAEPDCYPNPFRGITVCLSWDWRTEDFVAEIELGLHDTGLHDDTDSIWSDDGEAFCTTWAAAFDDLDAVREYPPHERACAATSQEIDQWVS